MSRACRLKYTGAGLPVAEPKSRCRYRKYTARATIDGLRSSSTDCRFKYTARRPPALAARRGFYEACPGGALLSKVHRQQRYQLALALHQGLAALSTPCGLKVQRGGLRGVHCYRKYTGNSAMDRRRPRAMRLAALSTPRAGR